MKRILVLYRELAGYFVECLNHLCDQHNVEAHVIAYPVHSDAPFHFHLSSRVKVYPREEYTQESLINLVKTGDFQLIFCGGWFDKGYLEAIRSRKCNALLGFDNQWNGSVRHIASALYGRIKIKPLFEYAFIPGSKQALFARKLGFGQKSIISGAYSCNVLRFSAIHKIREEQHRTSKKKLIYAGRYADEKFIIPLCNLMKSLFLNEAREWELHCIGTGPLWGERVMGNGIFHHGFMQPEQLFEFMKQGDAFILPSSFEPWGVVVHEFASAGYPLILSDAVGSSEIFLHHDENGYLFRAGDVPDLRDKLIKLFSRSDDQLKTMGQYSAKLAAQITPDTWAKSLHKLM